MVPYPMEVQPSIVDGLRGLGIWRLAAMMSGRACPSVESGLNSLEAVPPPYDKNLPRHSLLLLYIRNSSSAFGLPNRQVQGPDV